MRFDRFKHSWRSIGLRWMIVLSVALGMMGCAANQRLVNHSFEFDARKDSPDITILDYRYGNSKNPSTSNPDWVKNEGRSLQSAGTYGAMLVGDFLFVKWKIKSTDEIVEDTVDLRSRLPHDIAEQTVYFVVMGRQLYVYLISSERRASNQPPIGPRVYRHLKTITLYPDEMK